VYVNQIYSESVFAYKDAGLDGVHKPMSYTAILTGVRRRCMCKAREHPITKAVPFL
jgi:hypothetical protein